MFLRKLNSCPWVACQKVALEAFPFHPWVEVEQSLPPFLVLPYRALEVQAGQEAATEHTYSAENIRVYELGISIAKASTTSLKKEGEYHGA